MGIAVCLVFAFMLRITAVCLVVVSGAAAASTPCEDAHSGCGSWADGGECSKNPSFMKDSCAESCGFCSAPLLLDSSDDPMLGDERVVLSIQFARKGGAVEYGDVVLGFYPLVAPVTVAHI